jgi:hypothetical protein
VGVGDHLDPDAGAAFRGADTSPPFLRFREAGVEKQLRGVRMPAASNSSTTAAQTAVQTPALVQSRNRRQQVTPEGKHLGILFQRMRLRST